jgi:hypothetical protein
LYPPKEKKLFLASPTRSTGPKTEWIESGIKFKLRRGRRRRGYSISDELLRGFNVLGLAEGIISLILHGPGKWRALARKRKKK